MGPGAHCLPVPAACTCNGPLVTELLAAAFPSLAQSEPGHWEPLATTPFPHLHPGLGSEHSTSQHLLCVLLTGSRCLPDRTPHSFSAPCRLLVPRFPILGCLLPLPWGLGGSQRRMCSPWPASSLLAAPSRAEFSGSAADQQNTSFQRSFQATEGHTDLSVCVVVGFAPVHPFGIQLLHVWCKD